MAIQVVPVSKERPSGITAIGWIVILGSLSTLFLSGLHIVRGGQEFARFGLVESTILHWVVALIGLISALINLVAGIFILSGKNWARWLYIIWGAVVHFCIVLLFAITAFVGAGAYSQANPFVLGFGTLIFLLFAWILTQRNADYYFKGPEESD